MRPPRVGALPGSRLREWRSSGLPLLCAALRTGGLISLLISPGGKTIVGGLLGGWLAVEVAKRFSGIRSRTGDLFVIPLLRGNRRGAHRVLPGGPHRTIPTRKATQVPWAVDFGDHVPRHPVQLYEVAFLALLAVVVSMAKGLPEGARFRIFLAGYLAWRIAIDFLKPQPLVLQA